MHAVYWNLAYSYFEKGCRNTTIPTRQFRKLLWDMINTLFLTLLLSNLLLLLFFSTRKRTFMASHAILSNFFEEEWTQHHPQYLSGLSRALFPTTFLEIAVYEERRAVSRKWNNTRNTLENFGKDALFYEGTQKMQKIMNTALLSQDVCPWL